MKSFGNYFYVKKVELKSDFTQIPNALFYINLTATEKLILAYLLSNSESFRVTNYRISKTVGSDHRTIKKAMKKFREMKLILSITNKTIAININEIIKLVSASRLVEENNGDSPNSTITTDSTITNSNPTSNIVGHLPTDSSNSTDELHGELPSNNNKQQEIEKEKQKEVFASFTPNEIQNSIDDYLSKTSRFFFGGNKNLVVNTYTGYWREYPISTLSIYEFEKILYYQLLMMTMSNDVNDLNNYLTTHPISIQSADVFTVNKIINEKPVVQNDFKKIINEVNNSVNDNDNVN